MNATTILLHMAAIYPQVDVHGLGLVRADGVRLQLRQHGATWLLTAGSHTVECTDEALLPNIVRFCKFRERTW